MDITQTSDRSNQPKRKKFVSSEVNYRTEKTLPQLFYQLCFVLQSIDEDAKKLFSLSLLKPSDNQKERSLSHKKLRTELKPYHYFFLSIMFVFTVHLTTDKR